MLTMLTNSLDIILLYIMSYYIILFNFESISLCNILTFYFIIIIIIIIITLPRYTNENKYRHGYINKILLLIIIIKSENMTWIHQPNTTTNNKADRHGNFKTVISCAN